MRNRSPIGGWLFADSFESNARRFWTPAALPSIIGLDAVPCLGGAGSIDLIRTGLDLRIHEGAGEGRLLCIARGDRRVWLALGEGEPLAGPFLPRFILGGSEHLAARFATLKRMAAIGRHGDLPASLFPSPVRAPRLIAMLRAFDATMAGASHRQIAEVFFGKARTRCEWEGPTDFLRSRTRRMIKASQAMVARGYLDLLKL